jgi:hypothetical protein
MFIPIGVVVCVAGYLMFKYAGMLISGGLTFAVGLVLAGVGIPYLSPVVHSIRSTIASVF